MSDGMMTGSRPHATERERWKKRVGLLDDGIGGGCDEWWWVVVVVHKVLPASIVQDNLHLLSPFLLVLRLPIPSNSTLFFSSLSDLRV